MNLNQAKKKWKDTWWRIPPHGRIVNPGRSNSGVYHITAVYKPAPGDLKNTWLLEYTVYPDITSDTPCIIKGYQDDTTSFFAFADIRPIPITYTEALVHIL